MLKRIYKQLAKYLIRKSIENNFILISIDGPGGSGKSFFSDRIAGYLPKSQIIHFDDFYFENTQSNHDSHDIYRGGTK